MRSRKKTPSLTEFFQQEMIKEAQVKIQVDDKDTKKKQKDEQKQESQPAQNQPPAQAPPPGAASDMVTPPAQGAQIAPQEGGMPPDQAPVGGIDPNTGAMMPTPQVTPPIADSNSMRQAGLPTTAIVCTSDCKYAQNEKGMCSLNKIGFNQVKVGVFECLNYEPAASEPLVTPQEPVGQGGIQ